MDIYGRIEQRKRELRPLYDVMDSDLEFYNLAPYKLKDYDGKTAVKRVDNVTLNDPRTFANRVMSVINSAEMVVDITGTGLSDTAVAQTKDFLFSRLRSSDKRLKRKRVGRLRNNLVKIAALRGVVGLRVLFWADDKGNVIHDILPLDTRFCAWEFGSEGLLWGSHEREGSKAAIEAEYDVVVSGKSGIVTEYFDDKQHQVYVGHEKIKDEENTLGYPPMFITPVGGTMMLRDPSQDSVKYEGSSIYVDNRQVYNDMNKMASIWMTTAAYGFRPPMQRIAPSDQEPEEIPEDAKNVYTGGATVVDAGHSKFELMPLKDINASLPAMFGVFSATKQRGSFPNVEYGEISYPLSAIAIAKLTEGRNQIFEPIIEALSDCYQFLFDEIKSQDSEYPDVEHEVEVTFHPKSPEENISNYSVAAAARGFLDQDTIRNNILKVKDEGEVQRNLDKEFAEAAVPELRLYRVAKELEKDESTVNEAKLIMRRLGMNLSPGGTPAKGEESPQSMQTPVESPMPPLEGTMQGSVSEASKLATQIGSSGVSPTGGQ